MLGGDLSVETEDGSSNGHQRLGGAAVTLWLALPPEP
jgi:hypothetical protein